jgi:hypothetical protein
MKYFYPDSQDFVDPSFDFDTETRSEVRIRQQDDQYPHEVFAHPPYDGLLVSKAIVEGHYTMAQRQRLLRVGVRAFFRLDNKESSRQVKTMGDCGAFQYIKEKVPPFSVDDVLGFYLDCGFDYGISVDHIILAYEPEYDNKSLDGFDLVPEDLRERQEITLALAEEFFRKHKRDKCKFVPIGVAQGWSPKSYAHSVSCLQKIGYTYIAMGGVVPLKTVDIVSSLRKVQSVIDPRTELHLLGVTRCEEIPNFQKFGVVSFDSTAPLRKAFKDVKDNFFTPTRTYSAVRVPQVQGNPSLERKIVAGLVDQVEALRLERQCMLALTGYDSGTVPLADTIDALHEYERLHSPGKEYSALYRQVLMDKPWKQCDCEICKRLGIHVVMFRGAERNRRRGFHNLYVFYRTLQRHLDRQD